MTRTVPDRKVILDAVTLACRAPSLHNSQPWRWKNVDGAALYLFADRKRLVPATDRSGREMILSCGAVLDHLRVAIAAAGWDTLESTLRGLVDAAVVMLDVVPDDARPQLADASRLTEGLRRQDPPINPNYAGGHRLFELDQGVPPTSRVSASEASRVDVARAFPTTGYGERSAQIGPDRSKIIVLSPRGETSLEVADEPVHVFVPARFS